MPIASNFIDLYHNFEKGILPYDGALLDQPSKIIDIFNIIDGNIRTIQAKQQKEAELEAKRKAPKNGKLRRS